MEALDNAIESGIFVCLIESSSSEDELETIEELLIIRESSLRSLSTGASAGRHGGNSLEAYIHLSPSDLYSESIVHHFGSLLSC